MRADMHFSKGERMEASQAKLAPATDWEAIIEMSYQAAHQFIMAGAEWQGVSHPSNHPHAADAGLLVKAGAANAVQDAWNRMEIQRASRVYGKQPDGVESGLARARLQLIKQWAEVARP